MSDSRKYETPTRHPLGACLAWCMLALCVVTGSAHSADPSSDPAATAGPVCRQNENFHVWWRAQGAQGKWYPAQALSPSPDGVTCRVRYTGYGPEWDESVAPNRIYRRTAGDSAQVHQANTPVTVYWKGRWYQATVLEVHSSASGVHAHRVRYVGYGPEWDEWVAPNRIRSR